MTFHANGKLLLTGEYFVLDGALALALPVRLGQGLECQSVDNQGILTWQSFDEKGVCWFDAVFQIENFNCLQNTDEVVSERLQKILREASQLSARPVSTWSADRSEPGNFLVKTRLEFPRNWGLGSSSTLIYCVAQWAQVNAFELQFRTFGGSGYDVACAGADSPILYRLKNGQPKVEACSFEPPFANCLYFIYLSKKQDSREGIARYRAAKGSGDSGLGIGWAIVDEISELTREFLAAGTLADFEKLILEHERLAGETLKLPRAKTLYFNDFWGEIKSLGAWGGDFVLATSDLPEAATKAYFHQKGFEVVLPFFDLALAPGSETSPGNFS